MPKEEKRNEVPTVAVMNLRKQGLSNTQIIETLKKERYNSQQIFDALNQADIKNTIENHSSESSPSIESEESNTEQTLGFPEAPEPPLETSYSNYEPTYGLSESRENTERIEEIAEAIIGEKWGELTQSVGDISLWKEKVNTDILSIKQEILRTQERIENLQKAILHKVEDYNKTITDVNSEMKALEKVFERILEPLTSNIKELNSITKELKRKR